MKKKIVSIILGAILVASVISGCSAKTEEPKSDATTSAVTKEVKEVTITVGASVTPHAEILNFVKPSLKAQGINLVVKTLDDDGQLNPALNDKQIDANYFQHVPYLDSAQLPRSLPDVDGAVINILKGQKHS